MNKITRAANDLQCSAVEVAARLQQGIEHYHLQVASTTHRLGFGKPDPDRLEDTKKYLRRSLGITGIEEGFAVLTEPVFVESEDEFGFWSLTVMALALPWSRIKGTAGDDNRIRLVGE